MIELLIIILTLAICLIIYLSQILFKIIKNRKNKKDLYTISFTENNIKYTKIRDKEITYYIYSIEIGNYNYIFPFNKAAEQSIRRAVYDILDKKYDESCGITGNIEDIKLEKEIFINSFGYYSFHTYTNYYGNVFYKTVNDVWNINVLTGEVRYEGEWYPFSFNTKNIDGNFNKVTNQFNEYIKILETKDKDIINNKIRSMFIS